MIGRTWRRVRRGGERVGRRRRIVAQRVRLVSKGYGGLGGGAYPLLAGQVGHRLRVVRVVRLRIVAAVRRVRRVAAPALRERLLAASGGRGARRRVLVLVARVGGAGGRRPEQRAGRLPAVAAADRLGHQVRVGGGSSGGRGAVILVEGGGRRRVLARRVAPRLRTVVRVPDDAADACSGALAGASAAGAAAVHAVGGRAAVRGD